MILIDELNSASLTPAVKAHLLAVDEKARERMRRQDEAAAEFYRRQDNSGVERLGTVIERLLSINADLVQPQEASAIS